MVKRRFIGLNLAGRNLIAPPEGYTAKTAAFVKKWLSDLPKPAEAVPDDVVSLIVRDPNSCIQTSHGSDQRMPGVQLSNWQRGPVLMKTLSLNGTP
jgi:hypothetical protein